MSSIRNIKDVLIGAGFSRMFIVFFYGERHAKLTGQKLADHFQVANPINPIRFICVLRYTAPLRSWRKEF